MSIETPGQQFELPIEPKLNEEDITELTRQIEHYTGINPAITFTEEIVTILLNANGVATTFSIDNYSGKIDLVLEKSYDLFEGEDDYTNLSQRPLQSTEKIHNDRLHQLEAALEETTNPSLIE